MVESGIGIPVVHDKYSYCHGRSTLGINYNGIAIYYNMNTEFDRIMLEELKQYYNRIIIIDSKFEDQILDDYQMLIKRMYLTKYIAKKKYPFTKSLLQQPGYGYRSILKGYLHVFECTLSPEMAAKAYRVLEQYSAE